MANTTEDMIKQMYESQLASQKEQLATDYAAADSRLTAQQQQNQKVTDENLNRTAVEAQKDAINRAEYYAAAGLTSGARAQARLAQDTQLQANLTAIRTAQQAADAETERQRSLLSQEYAAAIRKAQSENDMQKAQALYEHAKEAEQQLMTKQEAAAGLMAQSGDFSRLAAIYGLTDAEVAVLKGDYEAAKTAKALEGLKTKYPNGTVGSRQEWTQLVADFGEDVLREAGLIFQPEVQDKIPNEVLLSIQDQYNNIVTNSAEWQQLLDTYGAALLKKHGITYQPPAWELAYLNPSATRSDTEPTEIYNSHGDSWIYIPGKGRFSYPEVQAYVDNGTIEESVVNGKLKYTWVRGAK
jgi:hypothetical protein